MAGFGIKSALALVAVAAFWHWVQFYSLEYSGGFPLSHVGIAYGFVERELDDVTEVVQGKTFLVTGANSGLGYSTSKLLAKHGARVVLSCRTMKKCAVAIEKIKSEVNVKGELISVAPLDLSSLKSVREFAKIFNQDKEVVRGNLVSLVLNAGFLASEYRLTETGVEGTFFVNNLHTMVVPQSSFLKVI